MPSEAVTLTTTVSNEAGTSAERTDVFQAFMPGEEPPPPPPQTPLGVMIGTTSANSGLSLNGVVWDRTTGDYTPENMEDQIETDASISGYRKGVERRKYLDLNTNVPCNDDGLGGRWLRDQAEGRMILCSQKFGSGQYWGNVASGAQDARLRVLGDQYAAYQDDVRGTNKHGANMLWVPHHEPNVNGNQGESGTREEFRAMYQHIIEVFISRGVTIWEGTQAGETTTEGLMLCGPVLVANTSGSPVSIWNDWWPTNWSWGNEYLVASGMDGYNQAPQNGGVWRTFQEVVGGHPSKAGYKSWSDAKKASQNAQGRVHFQTIWETGCREASASATAVSAPWTATGLSRTKANWMENMRDYIVASWDDLYALTWFDSQGPNGAWLTDTTQASWDKWCEILQDSVFEHGND